MQVTPRPEPMLPRSPSALRALALSFSIHDPVIAREESTGLECGVTRFAPSHHRYAPASMARSGAVAIASIPNAMKRDADEFP